MPKSDRERRFTLPKLRPHKIQYRLFTEDFRFKVTPAGRRSGKTEISKRKILKEAIRGTRHSVSRFFCAAPTRDQAKRIFWADLKRKLRKPFVKDVSDGNLVITLDNNNEIHVLGMDKPERIEGLPWDGGVLDEYGNMKQDVWPEHVRPALSDRMGWCWMIGVPEGRNHYYDLFREAGKNELRDWSTYTWPSADILPPEEIEAAQRDLDPLTFDQEYNASFVTFEGRCYYCFTDRNKRRSDYDPEADLYICLDFNVSPGVAAIIQEEAVMSMGVPVIGESKTQVIDEVYIKRNSNTMKVCQEIIEKYGRHQGDVLVYGDATGGAKGTSKIVGSDWDLVEEILRPVFGRRISFDVPRANPRERSRVNAVNSRLCNVKGQRRLFVDPVKAPNVVQDFEGVRSMPDGSIDKRKDPMLTHISDGIGYYIAREFPVIDVQEGMIKVVGL